jgi:C1A family cysteine protease
MKKELQLFLLLSILSWSANGQSFVRVTQSDFQHEIKIAQNEALEVRLPSTPSTGFAWYLKNNNELVKQAGNWEFISDNPANPIGASGTQITRVISVAKGTMELELLYKRLWEDVSQATDSYKIIVVSEGAYTGKEIQSSLPTTDQSSVTEKNESALALPASFSWEAQGKCTKVKNQGGCGSCWAFAACGSFESAVKIWDNVDRDMSEQWLVNCTSGMNCSGGMFPGSMFKNTGCVYEANEPYKAKNGTCQSSYTYHEKPAGFKQIASKPTTDQIKQAIYNYGPVWAGIDAGSHFDSYTSGVLTQTDGTQCNHAIVLCGWDDATGSWVLRNSWGTGWGEKSGYMRIKYGVSGVGESASYFDYKGVINHGTTGISEVTSHSLNQVFPNPSSGEFIFSGLENNNTIEIYDFVGKQVYQTTSTQDAVTIDLKDKSQGVYFYKIINASTKGVETGKIMVY